MKAAYFQESFQEADCTISKIAIALNCCSISLGIDGPLRRGGPFFCLVSRSIGSSLIRCKSIL